MGKGDFDYRKHVRSTIYCGKGKGTGKDDMASDVGQGTGKDHSPKSEQLEDAEALQTPRECSRETVECAEEPAQDGDSPRSTHVASYHASYCLQHKNCKVWQRSDWPYRIFSSSNPDQNP